MQIIIAQIPITKRTIKYGDEDFMFGLLPMTRFGSHNQKFRDFQDRHLYINRLLEETFKLYYVDRMRFAHNFDASLVENHNTITFHIQTILYWLRKNCDELIGLHYYYDCFLSGRGEPEDLKIGSIGALLNNKGSDLYSLFAMHLDKLKIINEISNTYKHSFINSEVHHLYGKDFPTVNSLDPKGSTRGPRPENPVFLSYYLHDVIHWYSAFFLDTRNAAKDVQKKLREQLDSLRKKNPEGGENKEKQ